LQQDRLRAPLGLLGPSTECFRACEYTRRGEGEGAVRRIRIICMLLGAAGLGAMPRLATGQPVFATEDSLQVYVAPETTRVHARRVPLAEIIRKAQQGEVHKYDGISTLAFTRTIKVTLKYSGKAPETRCIESVHRVYYREPEQWAQAPVRESQYIIAADGKQRPWEIGEGDDFEIQIDDESGRLSEVPDYLEDTDKYNFGIAHRSLQRDQVLYEITFAPRSEFDVLPGGRIWILTGGYQIVREEYELKNLPVPWLLKSLGLLTREWQQVDDHWVPRRVTARAELRSKLGLGMVAVPRTVEAVVLFDDYRFDLPLDAALFEPANR